MKLYGLTDDEEERERQWMVETLRSTGCLIAAALVEGSTPQLDADREALCGALTMELVRHADPRVRAIGAAVEDLWSGLHVDHLRRYRKIARVAGWAPPEADGVAAREMQTRTPSELLRG